MFGSSCRAPFATTTSARPISRQSDRQPRTGTGQPPGGRKRLGRVTSAAAGPSAGRQARTRTLQPRSDKSAEAVSTNCSIPPACGSTKLETISACLARGAGARVIPWPPGDTARAGTAITGPSVARRAVWPASTGTKRPERAHRRRRKPPRAEATTSFECYHDRFRFRSGDEPVSGCPLNREKCSSVFDTANSRLGTASRRSSQCRPRMPEMRALFGAWYCRDISDFAAPLGPESARQAPATASARNVRRPPPPSRRSRRRRQTSVGGVVTPGSLP
jgi:hypothetical protein